MDVDWFNRIYIYDCHFQQGKRDGCHPTFLLLPVSRVMALLITHLVWDISGRQLNKLVPASDHQTWLTLSIYISPMICCILYLASNSITQLDSTTYIAIESFTSISYI